MHTKSALSLHFDETVAGMLACPVCHGDLRVQDERLICVRCGRRYPVVDGIPVLIPERAETDGEKPTG